MPKIRYIAEKLSPASLAVVDQANTIIEEYRRQGFRLTLRQLYYQFVARDLIPNRVREYKRLGRIVSDGRLMGLIDWHAIEDRARNLRSVSWWKDPQEILERCAEDFKLNPWHRQEQKCEVWIEKEALIGVIEGVCLELRVPHFACKGYVSQSEAWSAGRFRLRTTGNRRVTIFHLGDHDPSGLDMTRDLEERLSMFAQRPVRIVRLALNFDQVEEHKPPPNPAKVTDSRFEAYAAEYGIESWELDALKPQTISSLIRTNIESLIDREAWDEAMEEEEQAQETLRSVSENYDEVRSFLEDLEA